MDLSWTENNTATAWTIKYNEGTDFDPLTSGTSISVSSNPYTLTGLNDNTTYYVYVKSNCDPGNDESAWTGPISFATPCSPGTVPFFEGFENGFAHGTPVAGCWSQESEAGAKVWMANNTLTNYNRSPRSGSWNAYLEYNNSDWMFYDLQLELGKTYQLEFYARQDETSGATIGAAFGTAASSASMTNIIIPNSAVTNGNYQKFEGTFTPTTSGVYYIGIYGETNFDPWYISIDDISIYELVQCSGAPNAGTTADMAVCENQDFTITATGAVTTEENLTGRWDYSTDQINWTAIPNSFNKTYTVVGGVSEETYFRFVATCNGADSTHSNVMTVSLKTANECYCEPLAVPGCVDTDDDINDFELIGENGTQISDMGTGCTSSSYLDQTTSFAPVDLYTDQTYTGLITTNSYFGDVSAAIWIDFNDDGVFSPSELVGGGLDVDWYEEYSITIPSDAQLGTHRMRIVLDYDLYGDIASFDPCETVYGEVHDYMVNIICNPTNFVNLGADDAYCVGDVYSKNLDAGNAGATYLWPDGSTNQVLEVTTAGKYYVDVTRSNGCSASDTVVITENALPIVDLGADDDYCIGTPYSKTLDAGNTGATYLWSDGSTDQTLEVTTAGTYYVDVKDNNGCSSSDTVVIVENALPTVDLGPDGILCAGSTVTLDAGVVDSYLWSDGSIGQTLEVTTSGKYYVDVTNAAGCSASDTVEITIHTMPVVALGGDQTICDGTITLDAGNAGATYAWSNGDTTQIVTVNTSGTYSVEVDNNGCIAVDTVVITISDEPEAGNITATNSGCDFDFGITNTANATSYDWDFGDGKTETTTTAYTSHTYAEEGVYTVKVTAKNDCGQITKEVDVSCIEGSVEDIAANRVAMYPNPTSSVVTLEATVDMTTITIIDNVGKVVYQTSPNHTMNYQMNVSELSNGFYTIIITTDSGVITKKLEVMKY